MIEPEKRTVTTATGEHLDLVLRTLDEKDYDACLEIQHRTWGEDFKEVVPPSMMMINQKLGGVLAGAFAPDGALVAFVFGQTGVRHGRFFHWSHMLAVDDHLRGAGVGRYLKLFQRRFLLDLGVDEVEWTYDPLESRNAHLNLNRLGGEPVEYLRDVYGDGSTSTLHSGIGTDRFVVLWKLSDPRIVSILDQPRGRAPESRPSHAPIVNVDDHGNPQASLFELPDLPELRVEIPSQIQQAKEESMDTAKRWRSSTRFAFETGFERGYRVLGLDHDKTTQRSFYLLLKP